MAEPPIKVIPTTFRETIDLLKSEPLRSVERMIADQVGMRIMEDYSSVPTNYTLARMSVSGMTASEIEAQLRDHGDRIASFAVRCLKEPFEEPDQGEGDPESIALMTGFGVWYAIYDNFLTNRSSADFQAFLKNRRISRPARFARYLRQMYERA